MRSGAWLNVVALSLVLSSGAASAAIGIDDACTHQSAIDPCATATEIVSQATWGAFGGSVISYSTLMAGTEKLQGEAMGHAQSAAREADAPLGMADARASAARDALLASAGAGQDEALQLEGTLGAGAEAAVGAAMAELHAVGSHIRPPPVGTVELPTPSLLRPSSAGGPPEALVEPAAVRDALSGDLGASAAARFPASRSAATSEPGLPLGESSALAVSSARFGASTLPSEVVAIGAAAGTLLAGAMLGLSPLASALYHRLRKDELLTQPRRKAVFDWVKAHPGTTASAVARALEVHHTTALHHLDFLVKFGWLTRRAAGASAAYYPNEGRLPPEEERRLAFAAAGPENVRLLSLVAARPGLRQRDVREASGLAPSTVSRRVAILRKQGLLHREGRGLLATPEGHELIQRLGAP